MEEPREKDLGPSPIEIPDVSEVPSWRVDALWDGGGWVVLHRCGVL